MATKMTEKKGAAIMGATRNTVAAVQPVTPPETWNTLRLQQHENPWDYFDPSKDIFRMLANEAKACLYELHREHVEHFYGNEGWTTNPQTWEPMGRERDAIVWEGECQTIADRVYYRYGNTYRVARDRVAPSVPLPGSNFPDRLFGQWSFLFFNGPLMPGQTARGEIRELLNRHNYAEGLKEEIREAFNDFHSFKIGAGEGDALMQRLEKDEQGRAAIGLTEHAHGLLSGWIHELLDEPFGITRDFVHLWETVNYTLNAALLPNLNASPFAHLPRIVAHWNRCRDTHGMEASHTLRRVLDRSGVDKSDVEAVLNHWVPLYIDRVKAIANRWKDHDDVGGHLDELIQQVGSWKMMPEIEQHMIPLEIGGPERTAAESATLEVVRGLEKLQVDLFSPLNNTPTLKWMGNTSELCELLHLLAANDWLEVPKSRSKLAERVHAVFHGMTGEPLDLDSLRQQLKPAGHRPLRSGVEFSVSRRPATN